MECANEQKTEVKELQDRGEAFLANKKHGEAIKTLSQALKLATQADEQLSILLIRSRAFTGMATWLKCIPASESETRAIIGLDPTTLAQLGLTDAKKASSLSADNTEAYLRQGEAQTLLERYAEAEQAYLEGLSIDPTNKELRELLSSARRCQADSRPSSPSPIPELSRPKRRRAGTAEDAECGLCIKLLYEPVTTPCGHSFCRTCFLRSMDHSSKCPMCRTVLHVGREIPVTLALRQLIEKSFPEEYAARQKEESGSGTPDAGLEAPLPLFVMSCILPGERMRLNIFEPRYRLMIRRCMEGSRRFGMALVSTSGQLNNTACEVEITECQPVPDGRYLLEIEGKRRFSLVRSWEQDGYRMGQPTYFHDAPIESESSEGQELAVRASQVLEKTTRLISRLRSAVLAMGNSNLEVMDLLRHASQRPRTSEYEKLSFWFVNLLPMDVQERLQMLSSTSTLERLDLGLRILASPRRFNY